MLASFSEKEALELLNSCSDVKKRYILILNLSEQKRARFCDEIISSLGYVIDDTIYPIEINMADFIKSFKDESIKNQVILELYHLSYDKFDNYYLENIIEQMHGKQKIELFKAVVRHQLNGETEVINSINIVKILNSFPKENRKEILEVLDDLLNLNIILSYNIADIINLFDGEEKLYIAKRICQSIISHGGYIDVTDFLNNFSKENWKEFVKVLVSKYESSASVYRYLNDIEYLCVDYSTTIFMIDMTLELQQELNINLISFFTFVRLIEKLSFNEKSEIFNKYIIEKGAFPVLKTIIAIKNLHFKYSVLELLIEKNYYKDNTFKIINEIILLEHMGVFPDGKIKYSKINELYCERYNLDKNNFVLFIDKFGYLALRFLDNKNIIDAINLPRDEFIKYINVFDIEAAKLSNNDINGICNSFLHREFRLANKFTYNIFSTIEHLINFKEENSLESLMLIIDEFDKTININTYLTRHGINKEEFIKLLWENNSNVINILHEITNFYISKKRDIYVNSRLSNIYGELIVVKKIEKQFYKKIYINQFDTLSIMNDIRFRISKENLNKEQLELIDNATLLTKLIEFKKSPNDNELTKEEKKQLKTFESILNILYERQLRSNELNIENAIYSYFPLDPSNEVLLNIMCNINPNIVRDYILNNNELYTKLLETLKKYHLLGWNDTFRNLTKTADIEFSDDTISGLISYFNKIYPKLDVDSNYLTKMLDYGNLYNYATIRYRYLLGNEDYRLIAANEGKNKASMAKYQRLSESVDVVKKMYERKYTTIPPMDKTINISGKSIGVTIGNSTNTINLTYGERTNACLRIGGAFSKLFNFCIENENGFHIRFTNPNTGKFVSRVSGIRNGNTLFLNELRDSVDDSYDNNDLYEALKLVSEELINISKDSEVPIDNIIVTSDYALREHENEEITLNLNGNRDALYNLPFNLNIDSDFGIVLKTSNNDNSLVPYIFNSEKVPRYECQRDKVRAFKGNEATERVIQLQIINELVNGKDLDEIDVDKIIDFSYCISGEDWYIGRTVSGEILSYVMPNSKNKEKAMIELNVAMDELQSRLQNKEQLEEKGNSLI